MEKDYSPSLIVTHCLSDTEGKYFLLMWNPKLHEIFAFDSESGISRITGLEDKRFETYEEACQYLDETIEEIPMPQG